MDGLKKGALAAVAGMLLAMAAGCSSPEARNGEAILKGKDSIPRIAETVLTAGLRDRSGPAPLATVLNMDLAAVCRSGPYFGTEGIAEIVGEDRTRTLTPFIFMTDRSETDLLYLVSADGEAIIELDETGELLSGGDCHPGDVWLFPDGERWIFRAAPGKIGSSEGEALLKRLSASAAPVRAGEALGLEGIDYVCLRPENQSGEDHRSTIRAMFGVELSPSTAPAPNLNEHEYALYVRGEDFERFVVFPFGEGLSPHGEYCVEGARAVFDRSDDAWRLARRD